MRFLPAPNCKLILHSLLLSVLMTAVKGRSAVELLAEPLALRNAHVVNFLSLCSYVKLIVKFKFFRFG
jgi:hypothetical protein